MLHRGQRMKMQPVIRFILAANKVVSCIFHGKDFPCISGSFEVCDKCKELFDIPKIQEIYETVFQPSPVAINSIEIFVRKDENVSIGCRVTWKPKKSLSDFQMDKMREHKFVGYPDQDTFYLSSDFKDLGQFFADLRKLKRKIKSDLSLHKRGFNVESVVIPVLSSVAGSIQDVKITVQKL